MVTLGDGELKAWIDSERNQGRARDMGWLDHDRLGVQLPAFGYRLRAGDRSAGAAGEMLALRARVAGWYRDALAGIDGLGLPCVDMGGDRRGWFVFVVQLPAEVERDAVLRRLAERGIQSKPYLPAIHLMSYYRERFGHRPGELPVCEDVAARSLALPFFPEMTAGQVERVARELVRAVGR